MIGLICLAEYNSWMRLESTGFNLIHFGNNNSQEHSFWQDVVYEWESDSNHQYKVEIIEVMRGHLVEIIKI